MFEIFGIPSTALFAHLLLGLINGSFYALLSLGLAGIFGMLNIINFAHGAQYMMGAFAAFLLLDDGDVCLRCRGVPRRIRPHLSHRLLAVRRGIEVVAPNHAVAARGEAV